MQLFSADFQAYFAALLSVDENRVQVDDDEGKDEREPHPVSVRQLWLIFLVHIDVGTKEYA